MHVSPTRIAPSPEGGGRVRYSATVRYDDASDSAEECWIDFEASCADDLRASGNPWLVFLLPAAMHLNEPICIADPVDPLLLEGVHENMRVWKVWYPELHVPEIKVSTLPRTPAADFGRSGCFFSGGVDSFFSALFHDSEPAYMAPVDELVSIWGFDIPLSRPHEIEAARSSLAAAAQAMGKAHVNCWTNLRETRIREWEWNKFTCGTSLAAVGLCLEQRYWRMLAPASWGPTAVELTPGAMHILTEPNYSTLHMRYEFDGTSHNRVGKLGFLSSSQVALDYLRSCWETFGATNCSRCSKCIRTMIGLAASGALDRCRTFDSSWFSTERLRTLRLRSHREIPEFQIVQRTLPASCDPALRDALDACIENNTRYFSRVKKFEQLEMTPLVGWLFGHYKRNVVLDRKPRPTSE